MRFRSSTSFPGEEDIGNRPNTLDGESSRQPSLLLELDGEGLAMARDARGVGSPGASPPLADKDQILAPVGFEAFLAKRNYQKPPSSFAIPLTAITIITLTRFFL